MAQCVPLGRSRGLDLKNKMQYVLSIPKYKIFYIYREGLRNKHNFLNLPPPEDAIALLVKKKYEQIFRYCKILSVKIDACKPDKRILFLIYWDLSAMDKDNYSAIQLE